MPRRENRGSQLNSLEASMSFVSRTYLCYCGAYAPSLGRVRVTFALRSLTAGTEANSPADALPRVTPGPVAPIGSRPRGYSLRGQRRHQGRTDPRHHVARSRVRAGAKRRWCRNSHGFDARGRLPRDVQRERTRDAGSPYLAARKTPPDDGRRFCAQTFGAEHKTLASLPTPPRRGRGAGRGVSPSRTATIPS